MLDTSFLVMYHDTPFRGVAAITVGHKKHTFLSNADETISIKGRCNAHVLRDSFHYGG